MICLEMILSLLWEYLVSCAYCWILIISQLAGILLLSFTCFPVFRELVILPGQKGLITLLVRSGPTISKWLKQARVLLHSTKIASKSGLKNLNHGSCGHNLGVDLIESTIPGLNDT